MIQVNPQFVATEEAMADFSRVLRRVEQGESLTITRGGLPVAQLTPIVAVQPDPKALDRMYEQWEAVSQDIRLGDTNLKDIISEGRR